MIKNLNFDAAAATFFYKKIIKQIKFIIKNGIKFMRNIRNKKNDKRGTVCSFNYF